MPIQGQIIGYARTSTTDQKAGLEAQKRDLSAAGCTKVFHEELSAVATKRPELDRALDYLREGDTLVVAKPDRLARSTADLLQIATTLDTKGVTLRILSMNVDTSTPTGKLMLTMLGGIAEFERDLMLERQREGIAKAKADGKYKGRAPTARAKTDSVIRLKAEGLTGDAIASQLGIGRASVFRILRDAR
ncbi:recombinase family protein [Nitratireductor sp. GZWM139]|uniref:recombinase family protein n=1 Tax=Nitratireductor sp. GZWM139 TaxID=2950541 RepID=UPI0024BEDE8A|nr:recombinase family protein [Nitratireductor sp. GZWM139]MDJ1464740.1 recombinase family protein [Nitratireductor sp. GZWM139]